MKNMDIICPSFAKRIQLDWRSMSEGRCTGSRAVFVQFLIRYQFRKPQGMLCVGLYSESKIIHLEHFHFLGHLQPHFHLAHCLAFFFVLGPSLSDF